MKKDIKKIIRNIIQAKIKKANSQEAYDLINDLIKKENWVLFATHSNESKLWSAAFKLPAGKEVSINFELKEIWDGKNDPLNFDTIKELKDLIKKETFNYGSISKE